MAKKATNRGTCQACGSIQRLPGGRLSKHGYTVRWGFFSGVCDGAGHWPYEESKTQIEFFVIKVERLRDEHLAYAAALRKPATTRKAWVHEYVSGYYGKSSYQWREVEIRGEMKQMDGYVSDMDLTYVNAAGKEVNMRRHGLLGATYGRDCKTVLDVATALNRRYADYFDGLAKQAQEYIDWQRERVRNWKPAPLLPLD